MPEFEKELPSYRLAEVHRDDSLQAIAYRELGDASRWPDLVWINGLVWPFVSNDPGDARAGIAIAGSLIKIPSVAGVSDNKNTASDVYAADIRLVSGRVVDDGSGDFLTVSALDNLNQQLTSALSTPRGQLMFHPDYGCKVWSVLGSKNTAVANQLAAGYAKATIEADYRVSSTEYVTAVISGDVIRVSAKALAISGGSIEISKQVQ